jgi:signal peptidase I
MKPAVKTSVLLVGFIVFLLVFAFALLTYTRRVDGTSMLPTLQQGDLVVIDNVPMNSIHVGDVIVYSGTCSGVYYDGGPAPVIHRVVQVTASGFITKGDNNPGTDQAMGIARSPIVQSCIEGKVVFVVPYIELLASLPDGLNYVLAALIVIAVIAYELWADRGKPQQNSNAVRPSGRGDAPALQTSLSRFVRSKVRA